MTIDRTISSDRSTGFRRPRRRSLAKTSVLRHAAVENRESRIGGIDWSKSAILGYRTAAARDFADLVAVRMVSGTLPWTERQWLLHNAGRRGISRFEANLIIAAVANHYRPLSTAATPLVAARPARDFFVLRGLAVVVSIEVILIFAACHWLF
jgi:hypothetical protein